MVQISEVLNLIFDSLGLLVIVALYRGGAILRYAYLFLGFACIWASNVCTVAEGFFWYDALNLLEHLFFLAGALFLCVGFAAYSKKGGAARE